MPNFEDRGMSEEEFAAARRMAEKEIVSYAGQERERALKLYFEFDSTETRDRAIKKLNELRDEGGDYDERFRFFETCERDPGRADVGMEISFVKNLPTLRRDFEQLLKKQGLIPKEEYETIDGEPRPEETRVNGTT